MTHCRIKIYGNGKEVKYDKGNNVIIITGSDGRPFYYGRDLKQFLKSELEVK